MLQQISSQLRNPITAINENFSATTAAALFGVDLARTIGLTFAFYGGIFYNENTGGGYQLVANGDIVLPASEPDIFIEADSFGAVSANLIEFSLGAVPLYRAATSGVGITSLVDYRIAIAGLAPGGGAPMTVPYLYQLPDVGVNTALADGDVLTWNQALLIWENAPTAPAITDLAALTDVDFNTGLNSGDILRYDLGLALWVNTQNTIDGLTDVNIPAPPTNGDLLTWDSGTSQWIAAAPGGVTNPLGAVLDVGGYDIAGGDIAGADYARLNLITGSALLSSLSVGGEYTNISATSTGGAVPNAGFGFDAQLTTGEQLSFTSAAQATSINWNVTLQDAANWNYYREAWAVDPTGTVSSAGSRELKFNNAAYVNESWGTTPTAANAGVSANSTAATSSQFIYADDATGYAEQLLTLTDTTNTRSVTAGHRTHGGASSDAPEFYVDLADLVYGASSIKFDSLKGFEFNFNTFQLGISINGAASAAGAGAGTITDAPTAGDPGFWLPITINGTNYAIPAWAI